MAKNKQRNRRPLAVNHSVPSEDTAPKVDWHPGSVTWLLMGGFGVALLAGFFSLFLFAQPAVRESIGVVFAVLLFIYGLGLAAPVNRLVRQFSQRAVASLFLRGILALLPVIGVLLWVAWLYRPVNILCDVWRDQCRFGVKPFENQLLDGTAINPQWQTQMSELLGQKLSQATTMRRVCLECIPTSSSPNMILAGHFMTHNPVAATIDIIDAEGVYLSGPPVQATVEYSLSAQSLITLSNELTLALMERLGIPVTNATRFAIRQTPTASPSAMSLNNEGIVLYQQGRLDDAVARFQAALQIDSVYSTAHANLGAVLADEGNYEEAIPHYQRAVEFLPNYAVYPYNLGVLYAQLGRSQEAIAMLQQATTLDPAYVEAYNELGNVYTETRKWRQARQALEQGIQLQPAFAPLHKNLGRLDLAQQRTQAAIDALQTALNWEASHLLQHTPPVAWDSSEAITVTNQLAAKYETIDYLADPAYALLLRRDGAQEAIKLLLEAYTTREDAATACLLVDAYRTLDPNQISQWDPDVSSWAQRLGCS